MEIAVPSGAHGTPPAPFTRWAKISVPSCQVISDPPEPSEIIWGADWALAVVAIGAPLAVQSAAPPPSIRWAKILSVPLRPSCQTIVAPPVSSEMS
ncbi:MAG: hypothetical protein MPW14_03435 [Candidatus Manganitrophus sp.]|nr:MAG: hypothetical protein MPW14_03435 [Candidatus Manganitrophus sp.]